MNIYPAKAEFTIGDSSFDDYYSTIKNHFDNGTQTIQLYGIGKHIPTVIGLAQTFVEQGAAAWQKLNTESVEGESTSQGKMVALLAIISNKKKR